MDNTIKGYNLSIQLDDISLAYNDVGVGNVPIICLHGFPFDKSMWARQLDFLKTTNRVIAIDIRGFGDSVDEQSTLSIELFANDLIAFMDKLVIEKAIICGLSMGGFIALNAVNRFQPRFEALILCDTQCIADTDTVKGKRYETIESIKIEGVKPFNDAFIKNVFHSESLINKPIVVEQLTNVVFANSQDIIIRGLTALAEGGETCTTLNLITIPTLIICGREDKVTPLAQSEFMKDNISGSIHYVINNAGHVSNLEEPEEFNSYLHEFLKHLSIIKKENANRNQMEIT